MMRLDLDGLAAASREALMSEWREVVGRPPPKHLSKPLMVQILSHAYQVDTVGGYTKRLDRRLKSAAQRDVVRPAFKPGSHFVREDAVRRMHAHLCLAKALVLLYCTNATPLS